ncbi:hypothetical protein ABNX05_02365 [Lysinibacillus sp. M3]|uniref:Uncharacterized protein n=1 Tax=Lysinibacillus zambalensis TaxID=3160866 RepID=A0ABV1MNI8_9BACI
MERLEVIFMKKVIIGLCKVVTGFILFIAQDEFEGNDTANGIDKMLSSQPVHPYL